jgi:hypothetical protein
MVLKTFESDCTRMKDAIVKILIPAQLGQFQPKYGNPSDLFSFLTFFPSLGGGGGVGL